MPKVETVSIPLSALGKYPTGWQKKRMDEVCSLVTDGTHDSPKPVEIGGFPLVTGKCIKNRRIDFSIAYNISDEEHSKVISRSKPERGDVLFANIGNSIGDLVRVDTDREFSIKNVALFKPGPSLDSRFLEYYLLSNNVQNYIKGTTLGSAQPFIGLSALRGFPVPLPTMGEQKKIVKILGGLDNKIELNRQINQNLEEMAQAIFKSWFVDFEPVKAKIEAKANGQDPERAAMCAISGKTDAGLDHLPPDQLAQLRATAALFPDELTDSELGPIPDGWDVKTVKDWGSVICGKTPPKKDASNYGGDVPFIKIPDMHGNVFATGTSDSLSPKGASTQPKKQVPPGSICVSCIATVGLVVLTSEDSHTNQQINTIVPESLTHNYYLFFAMRERRELLHDLASGGSATLNLNTGNFSKILILYPGEPLLGNYYRQVASIFEAILINDKQSKVLENIRDTLLPKLLSGEIDLSQVA